MNRRVVIFARFETLISTSLGEFFSILRPPRHDAITVMFDFLKPIRPTDQPLGRDGQP
jgi:hypothetical protein